MLKLNIEDYSIGNRDSPITIYRVPLTNPNSPLTIYRLPFALFVQNKPNFKKRPNERNACFYNGL
jgi:hypothetical protein